MPKQDLFEKLLQSLPRSSRTNRFVQELKDHAEDSASKDSTQTKKTLGSSDLLFESFCMSQKNQILDSFTLFSVFSSLGLLILGFIFVSVLGVLTPSELYISGTPPFGVDGVFREVLFISVSLVFLLIQFVVMRGISLQLKSYSILEKWRLIMTKIIAITVSIFMPVLFSFAFLLNFSIWGSGLLWWFLVWIGAYLTAFLLLSLFSLFYAKTLPFDGLLSFNLPTVPQFGFIGRWSLIAIIVYLVLFVILTPFIVGFSWIENLFIPISIFMYLALIVVLFLTNVVIFVLQIPVDGTWSVVTVFAIIALVCGLQVMRYYFGKMYRSMLVVIIGILLVIGLFVHMYAQTLHASIQPQFSTDSIISIDKSFQEKHYGHIAFVHKYLGSMVEQSYHIVREPDGRIAFGTFGSGVVDTGFTRLRISNSGQIIWEDEQIQDIWIVPEMYDFSTLPSWLQCKNVDAVAEHWCESPYINNQRIPFTGISIPVLTQDKKWVIFRSQSDGWYIAPFEK